MAPERKEKLWECDYESFKLCSEIELEYWEAAYLLILSYLYQLIVSFSILTNVLEKEKNYFFFTKADLMKLLKICFNLFFLSLNNTVNIL